MKRGLRMRPALIAGLSLVSMIAAGATGEITGNPDWGLAVLGVCAVVVTGILKLVPQRSNGRSVRIEDIASVYEKIDKTTDRLSGTVQALATDVYEKIDKTTDRLSKAIQVVATSSVPRGECKLQEANMAQRFDQLGEKITCLDGKVEKLQQTIENRRE